MLSSPAKADDPVTTSLTVINGCPAFAGHDKPMYETGEARERSVAVVFDLEQGKRTQHVRHVCRRRSVEVRAVEFGESIDAEQAEAALHLVFQQLEKPYHPGLAAGSEREALHPSHADQVGATGDRLDDVGAAADRSVDDDFGAAGHRGHNLRQHVHGAAAVIELAAAVVGDVDP